LGETAELIIELGGKVRMIYSELVEPHALGEPTIERGSFVEPDKNGFWWATLTPVNGPRLGPYLKRSKAIQAEIAWLTEFWLEPKPT
jgi:hypothetical protein